MFSEIILLQVKRLLPNLHIFNSRPIDKNIRSKGGEVDIASRSTTYKEDIDIEEKKGQKRKKNLEFPVSVEKQDVNRDSDTEKELKRKSKKGKDKPSTIVSVDGEEDVIVEKGEKKKMENLSRLDAEKKTAQKGRKTSVKFSKKEVSVDEDGITGEEKPKKKKSEKRTDLDIIDDAGASFTELFAADMIEDGNRKTIDRAGLDMKSSGGIVTYPVKKKKSKHAALSELQFPAIEVGMGGSSTWDD